MADEAIAPSPEGAPRDQAEGLSPEVRACGNCRFFTRVIEESGGFWKGDCLAMKDRGLFPETAPVCDRFLRRGAPVPQPGKPEVRRPERPSSIGITVRSAGAPVLQPAPLRPAGAPSAVSNTPIPELADMTREELKDLIREALEGPAGDVRLAPRWDGGTLVIKPGNPELQSKEMPVDSLFHKVVMIRDRLRTLEQKINGHPKLSDAEKVEMQQYVTRCYGSLTSFNMLFADRSDYFQGEKGKAD